MFFWAFVPFISDQKKLRTYPYGYEELLNEKNMGKT